jgi:hypothetical protein
MQFKGQFSLTHEHCISDGQIPDYDNLTTTQFDQNAIEIIYQIELTYNCVAIATKVIHTDTSFKYFDRQNKHYCIAIQLYSVYEETIILLNYLTQVTNINQEGRIIFQRDISDVLRYYYVPVHNTQDYYNQYQIIQGFRNDY